MLLILALFLLAGCSGDGNNADLSKLRREQAATAPQPTAAPNVVYQTIEKVSTVVVQQTVRETVEVPVDRPVEVTREVTVYIEATPDVQGFNVQSDCDAVRLTPAPTVALDATDIAAGVVMILPMRPCVWATELAKTPAAGGK